MCMAAGVGDIGVEEPGQRVENCAEEGVDEEDEDEGACDPEDGPADGDGHEHLFEDVAVHAPDDGEDQLGAEGEERDSDEEQDSVVEVGEYGEEGREEECEERLQRGDLQQCLAQGRGNAGRKIDGYVVGENYNGHRVGSWCWGLGVLRRLMC